MVSAIAASGVPALVQARGHIIDQMPEIPFVIVDKVEGFKKTKDAVTFLRRSYVWADIMKVGFSNVLVVPQNKWTQSELTLSCWVGG